MIATLLLTIAIIFGIALAGILIDRLYRRFAHHNPQLGPFRPEGHQDCCSCASSSSCKKAPS